MTNWPNLFPTVNSFTASPTTDPETGELIRTDGELAASRVNDTTGAPTDPRGRIPYIRTDLVAPPDEPNPVAPFIYQDTAVDAAYKEIYQDPIITQALQDITDGVVNLATMTATEFANLSSNFQKLILGQLPGVNPNVSFEVNSQGETYNYAITFTSTDGSPELTAVLEDNGDGPFNFSSREVYLLQTMTKNDYAKLSVLEQERIAVLPAFQTLALGQNLRPSSDKTSNVSDRAFVDATRQAIGNGFKFELIDESNLQAGDILPPGFSRTTNASNLISQAIQRKLSESNLASSTTVGSSITAGTTVTQTITVLRNNTETQVQVTARPITSVNYFPGFSSSADSANGGVDPSGLFNRQVRLIEEQLSDMAIFSTDDIIAQVDEIADRYIRARYFGDEVNFPPSQNAQRWFNSSGPFHQVGVTDIGGTQEGSQVFSTFQNLIEQERVITSLAERRREFADQVYFLAPEGRGGTVQSAAQRRLDLPAIITFFQQMYNQKLEASVNAATEEVRALNALLNTYSAFQDVLNEALGNYTQKNIEDDNARDFDGVIRNDTNKIRATEFFDDSSSTTLHPVERIAGITTRPNLNLNELDGFFVTTVSRRQSEYSNLNNRISDAVTQLNQQTQLKQNDISSQDRQKNRHFDLANNAQRKLADTLQNIARVI